MPEMRQLQRTGKSRMWLGFPARWKRLALDRMLHREEIDGAVGLGIIERGETDHGVVMGQSVTKAVIELQITHNKPIGLGIIGPGAEPEHIEPRLEPHARAAVGAVTAMIG